MPSGILGSPSPRARPRRSSDCSTETKMSERRDANLLPAHLSGAMRDGAHILPVRVYYEDTDFSARVYHASYLRFMERGRTEILRAVEVAQSDLHAEMGGLAFVVRKMNIDFLGAAVMDDVLTVVTRSKEMRGASMILEQEVR